MLTSVVNSARPFTFQALRAIRAHPGRSLVVLASLLLVARDGAAQSHARATAAGGDQALAVAASPGPAVSASSIDLGTLGALGSNGTMIGSAGDILGASVPAATASPDSLLVSAVTTGLDAADPEAPVSPRAEEQGVTGTPDGQEVDDPDEAASPDAAAPGPGTCCVYWDGRGFDEGRDWFTCYRAQCIRPGRICREGSPHCPLWTSYPVAQCGECR